MFELVINFVGYAFAVAFWIAIFFTGRAVFRGIRSRRYARSAGFGVLVIALLWVGLYLGLTPGASAFARYQYTQDLFGRGFLLNSARLSYDSPRSFNGDGYSIEVFDISDRLSQWASSPSPEFTANYPVRPSYRSHWKSVPWRQTPVPVSERKFLTFALDEQAGNHKLDTAKKLLERLANKPGSYFTCFYFMHDDRVGDVDFFLLCPSEGVLIVVNHNT